MVQRASPPSQSARPVSRELSVDLHYDHRWDFPCCAWSPLLACRRQYPGRTDGTDSLVFSHQRRPSLECRRVGSCISGFEACTAFTIVTACMIAKSPSRPITPEASAASLPPLLLRLLPGGAIQFPGGIYTHCGPTPFTAHDIPRIFGMISRGWEAGVKALDRVAASAAADGLDTGRASARLLLSGECHLFDCAASSARFLARISRSSCARAALVVCTWR